MNLKSALAVRTHFSIGEAMTKPKEAVEKAKALGYESVVLMDTMTISGMTDFSSAAKAAEIKPVIGCRIRVVADPLYRKPKKNSGEAIKPNPEYYLKVYVKNDEGMIDLIKLLSLANSEEYFYYVPRVSLDDICNTLSNGNLLCSTGDFYSVFHNDKYSLIVEKLRRSLSSSELFSEIVPIDTPLFDKLNVRAIEIAEELHLAPIITYPVLYPDDGDSETLEVLAAINTNNKMASPWRPVPYIRDFYFHKPTDMVIKVVAMQVRLKKHHGLEDMHLRIALENNEILVKGCTYVWAKMPVTLPVMAGDEYGELVRLCKAGFSDRLLKPTLGYAPSKELLPKYVERLKYELSVLKEMGFERYFLVVEDLVTWSRSAGILVGPGRGSVGGSLVAYLLFITDVDPIRFDLLFERFINPERLDLPDADLDFMSSRRGEIIEYLTGRYGKECVAGIRNYGTLASSSALRDTGRVHELQNYEIKCSAYVPKEHGKPVSLQEAAEAIPEIAEFKKNYGVLWKHATRLEGRMRSMGKHAAGVVVSGMPISNRAVVERASGAQVVNWDKRIVEDWGLVKMDILGLSTLDVLKKAVDMIEIRHKKRIDLTMLPLDEPEVMQAFGEGRSIGVFQFESPGMRKLLRDLAEGGNLTFDDLAAATALYRPGPMDSGLMDDYISIKQGLKLPYYEHTHMEAALSPTNSVIVYQEQVMKLAQDLAGFTLAGADHLRKAMGKKDRDKMAAMRQQWVDGCLSHSSMNETQSTVLFDKIEAFAGYGFNKSHAVEYSIISYWTMYLKVHYPAEFYASALSVVGEDKLTGLVNDAKSHNVHIVPPHINESGADFIISYDDVIGRNILYTPFNRLKGLSDNTTNAILLAREKAGKPFESQADFLLNVNKTKCNKRHQAVLDKVGAFACVEPTQIAAEHPDRLKDQMELIPGLVTALIKADRDIEQNAPTMNKLKTILAETRKCEECSLKCGVHPAMGMGTKAKIMIVADCPNWGEEKANKMMEGKASAYLVSAIKNAGLNPKTQFYVTSLVKSPKQGGKLTTAQIGACSEYLKREVELLKPAVIITLGGASTRFFVPDIRGGFADLCGKVHYHKELDASIVYGINPGMIYIDPEKQNMLDDVLLKAAELIT
tara:strand:- start:100500 stop:103883 length:3384 start_codon:yes stop_codon:yes gene_type:complete